MPTFTKITFDNPINTSLQVGDAVYVSDVVDGIVSEPVYAQKVLEVGAGHVMIDKDPATTPVITTGQYILFQKRIEINESSLKGYYADVTFENSSNTKTELFAISSEVVPSLSLIHI